MLNWAVRYFPILRVLRRYVREGQPILEIGSGSFGLAHFYGGRIVGCDVSFPQAPEKKMLPVRCSGAELPFADATFEAVVASDVLEHVPLDKRLQVINEALRVTRRLAIFGFPCGKKAHLLDEEFMAFYRSHNIPPPTWLEEHMEYPFPDEELFDGLVNRWKVESFGNEHLRFHDWVNRREMSYAWNLFFRACLRIAPRAVEVGLRVADRPPFYRMIFMVTRRLRNLGQCPDLT